jgi:hypothetical protein
MSLVSTLDAQVLNLPSRSCCTGVAMSALGHKRKWCHVRVTVLPLKADIRQRAWHVR